VLAIVKVAERFDELLGFREDGAGFGSRHTNNKRSGG
jgi:hypothetical protein